MTPFRSGRLAATLSVALIAALLGGAASVAVGVCGPFTDVSDAAFCPFVLELFTLGITTGTSPTTYDPTTAVNRLQMAAFLSRTVDGVVKRGGNRQAVLNQFWTPQTTSALRLTTVGTTPRQLRPDGDDIWVANTGDDTVSRVHASDGRLKDTWTGATSAFGVLVAMGQVFVTGSNIPGDLFQIDPSLPAGVVTTVASNLGGSPLGITFDGNRIWTANFSSSVSIILPGATIPWSVTTVTAGFSVPTGALYTGVNVWITDQTGRLFKLDNNGAILQTVTLPGPAIHPVFDGANIWAPLFSTSSLSVVRASTGAVLATLTGNGLNAPTTAAFDGQRVLVTNQSGNSVSLWKAADLSPLGTSPLGAVPSGVCSDGVNFWIALAPNKLARF